MDGLLVAGMTDGIRIRGDKKETTAAKALLKART
jgi:hypothetical protein